MDGALLGKKQRGWKWRDTREKGKRDGERREARASEGRGGQD